MASIVVSGDTSGAVTITAPAIAGTTTLTLPTTSGTLVVTGGAQTIEFADGTVSAPSITNSGDTNTGIYFPAADTIAFTEGGVESMRIDSSGNVGIGTSSPLYKLDVFSTSNNVIASRASASNIAYLSAVGNAGTVGTSSFDIIQDGSSIAYVYQRANQPMLFATNNTERMRIDSSGNVGIGCTPSAFSGLTTGRLEVGAIGNSLFSNTSSNFWVTSNTNYETATGYKYATTAAATYYLQAAGTHQWATAASGTAGTAITFSERMRITAAGDVGIGTTTPGAPLQARGQNILSASTRYLKGWIGGAGSWGASSYEELGIGYSGIRSIYTSGDNWDLTFATGTSTQFAAGTQAESMRITSGGNVLIGTTDTSPESGVGFKYVPSTTAPYTVVVKNTSSNSTEWHLYNTNATNNGYRFYVGTNGGIYNYSANNVNLSDERTKENIELAGNYLNKICAIPVKTFNYKDEPTGEQKTLGVIAQDVETIAPEFVNNDGWKGTEPEDGVPLKTIYTTDMMFGLMKAIQELNAKVEAQAAEIQALKGAR